MQRKNADMQHIWLNYNSKGSNKGRWKPCNTRLIWLNCNGKGRWKYSSTKHIWLNCNSKGRSKGGLIKIKKPCNMLLKFNSRNSNKGRWISKSRWNMFNRP